MENQAPPSLLETLPQELLTDILARVAESSVRDLAPCLLVAPIITSAVNDDHVIKNLNLRRQARNPLRTFFRYQKLMKKSLKSDHPAAHYVEGIKQFFIYDNRHKGLLHLKKASEGSYDNATYLYGILKLCMGRIEEGKAVLATLGWETDKRRTNEAWNEVKKSMRVVFVIKKPEYLASLRNNQPPLSCHKNDKDNICASCFHYKMMRKFIGFVSQ
ncbi:unnamed protein product [Eruca vesicaria subsp. sativa]|uniref:At2g35280-like TPR domain-containing protein n=1 Tax=Eruca vesicaria subsp. sativa TaxID=29727 RepID=A0ABC8IWK3_ERUVS|nr:unnamed protein product [Eruca vesicaria subsp. sativa]